MIMRTICPCSLWRLLLPILAALTLESHAYSQSPLIPVQTSTATLPMLGEAIRDPKVLKNEVRDDLQASAVLREISEYESDLARAKGARARDLSRMLLSNYASLVAYYEDVLSGELSRDGNQASPADLSRARWQLVKHAATYAKLATSKSQLAQARYHFHTQKYVLGSGRAQAIAALKSIKGLDGYLLRRAQLVVALHELDHGTSSAQNRAKSTLAALIRPLHLEGAIVARLALARKHAGLNSRGHKYLRANKKYRYYLYHATKRAGRLSDAHKRTILAYAVGVWRAAEGRNATWSKSPIYMASFRSLKESQGIYEREALSQWRERQYGKAVQTYNRISDIYAGNVMASRVDNRILDIRASEYARTDRSRNYEAALTVMMTKYQNADVLGPTGNADAERMAKNIQSRYERLVAQEVRLAKSRRAQKSKRYDVIALITRYLDRLDDTAKRAHYEEITGDLYALNDDHTKAVGIYLDLAMNGQGTRKDVLYRKAVASQQIVAHWPKAAPWNGIKGGYNVQRTQLLNMYQDQLALYNGARWDIVAHIGLLNINLGDAPTAFKLWEATLAKFPRGGDAQQAAGLMLEVHHRTKNWGSQERLVRLCLKTGVQPRRGKQSFNLPALLAEALLNGGRQLLEAGNYQQAREKLAEFVAKFKNHRQHDEGQFYLAHGYRGEGNHKQSIATLVDLTKAHPKSEYFSRALILGGDWGMAMALEEETIYFHQLYVDKYPRGEETPRIRDSLVSLYQGRELIGEASDLLHDQAQDPRLAHQRRLDAALLMLELEERYGGGARAFDASKLVIKLAKNDARATAKALAYQVRHYNDQHDLARMQQLEARLAKLGGHEIEDALAEARFYIALYVSQIEREEIQSVALSDPLQTMNEEYSFYLRIKQLFDRVCSAGESGYCAPAMLEVSARADDMKLRIEGIMIPEVLDKKTVDTFETRKSAILKTMQTHNQSYVAKANTVVQRGNTNPTYTEQVLWENSSDWNFDRITGETGNGYIQFSPDLVVGE